MTTITRFEEMEAWQAARQLAERIHAITGSSRFSGDFALRDQMRRAAVSIVSNIAEGFESRTNALFVDFLGRARASAGELRAQLYVALDVGLVSEPEFGGLVERVESCSRQIRKFAEYLLAKGRAVREPLTVYDPGAAD